MMGEPEDPFRADMPEFDRPEEVDVAEWVERGSETANALIGMQDVESILRAVVALPAEEAKAALVALAIGNLQRRTQESGDS